MEVEWSVIAERKSKYYESCFWRVRGDGQGTLKISILESVRGSFSVYSGHSRSNYTALSPPYSVPLSSGALLFFQSNQTHAGTGRFSIQVEKEKMPVLLITAVSAIITVTVMVVVLWKCHRSDPKSKQIGDKYAATESS